MLRASDFSTASTQLVIFTPEPSEFSASNILAVVLGRYATLYDGAVQALPLPEDAHLEIPRVILQSKDGVFRLEAAPLRINFYWAFSDLLETDSREGISTCLKILEHYVNSAETQVYRLALVINRVHKTQDPARLIIEQFCKPELQDNLFKNSKNFELHHHEQTQLKDFSVNSWVRSKSAQLINDINVEPVLLLEQDINTFAEQTYQRFTVDQILEYFHLALKQSEETLQTYFLNE